MKIHLPLCIGAPLLSVSSALAAPDLRGYDLALGGVPYPFDIQETAVNWGDPVHIRFAVANLGNSAAGAYKVGIYISADPTIDPATDYRIFTYNVGGTAASTGVSVNYGTNGTITLPSVNPLAGAPSTVYFGMVVDVDGEVAESNESNNRNLGNGIDRDGTPLTITSPAPSIYVTDSASPSNDNAVAFGSVANDAAGNARGVQTLTIVNKGKASLNMSGLSLTGSPYFSIVEIASSTQNFINLSSLPRVIAAKGAESWVVTLQYDPAATGPHTGTLTIASNDPSTPSLAVSLSGTGEPVPDIALATTEAAENDFGGVVQDGAGGFSATRTVTLKNIGTGPLTVNQNGISLLTGSHYSIVSITSSTQGAINLGSGPLSLAADGAETWNVVVKFDPTATGLLKDGLKVLSNDPDEATFIASLTGTGVQPMHLAVTDSSGSTTDRAIAFPAIHGDGPGKESATATVTLTNTGEAALTIPQNGLSFLTGTQFRIGSITSSTAGNIDLTTAARTIAGGGAESWTVSLVFDPSASGASADSFRIASDDPSAAVTEVSLTGTGLRQPALSIADSVAPAADLAVGFGPVLNDGPGNRTAQQTVVLKNLGTQPLVISRNGIGITGGAAFHVAGIVSSTAGLIDMGATSAAARTLAPAQAEIWTVFLTFDPTSDTSSIGSLDITSNDPASPGTHISLTGQGVRPKITLLQPADSLNLSSGSVFDIVWQDDYPAGGASVSLYLDDDRNPADGLIPIATGLGGEGPTGSYVWRPDPSLAGKTYYIYATVTDGPVSGSSYSVGQVTIDAPGTFKLRSSQEVTSPDYAYEYEYAGQIYTGVQNLTPGSNLVTVTTPLEGGGMATNQFTVNLVSSLTHVETQTHDQLNRVETVKNGNGIVTTITYDVMGHVSRRSSSNGAVVDFSYDVLGRRTRMSDSTGYTFYEWNDLSRMTAVIKSKNATKGDSDDLPLRYEYDLAGHRTAIVYPGGERIEYSYDDAGRMKTVNNVTRSLLFTYSYNATTGQLEKLTRPNGIETLYSYNGLGQLTAIRHQKTAGAVLVAEFFYTLDAAGKATELRTTLPGGVIRREGYGYDRFDRLTQVVYADDGVIDANDRTVLYTYDDNGNRLTQTTLVDNVATEVRNYVYGNENRLLKVTDQTGATIAEYRYDSAGNRIQKITPEKTTNYSYDERNLMVSCSDGALLKTFEYDGANQRTATSSNGIRKVFVNNPTLAYYDSVQERDAMGTVISTSIFGGAKLAELADQIKISLANSIGSTVFESDKNGEVSESSNFDAFGKNYSSVSKSQFASVSVEPGIDLYFMRARFYDPETGVFVSKDPLGVSAATNQYQYAGSNPLSIIDPGGTEPTIVDQWRQAVDIDGFAIAGFVANASVGTAASVNVQLSIAEVSIGTSGFEGFYGLKSSQKLEVAGFGGALEAKAGILEKVNLQGDSAIAIVGKAGGSLEYYGASLNGSVGGSGVLLQHGNSVISNDPFESKFEFKAGAIFGVKVSGDTDKLYSAASSTLTYAGDNLRSFGGLLGDSLSDGWNNLFGGSNTGTISDFGNSLFGSGSLLASSRVGGVLLDKAATLVGSNLSDLRGAVYDPATGQFVFLGTEGSTAVKDINLDYLYTALQAVYGSAVPPSVTLDPPASAYTQWTDFGDGDGVFEIGENGGFTVRYNPIWSGVDTTVDVTIRATWSGSNYTWTARFNCVEQGISTGDRKLMKLVFDSWVVPPPAGVSLDTAPWQSNIFTQSSFRLDSNGQDSFTRFTLNNASTSNYIVNSVQVYPARQHRKFGGRVEGSQVGWVMLEADRVMKCLSVGKDNLTGASYNSGTVAIPGYKNMAERLAASGGAGGNIRMWFTPKEMTLKRHIDPVTGRASIIFDTASVACNTESFLVGLPQPPEAKAFADHLTANYDAFSDLSFPCVDYNDPTGTKIINVKIFDMLRDVMRSVSLARFFRDNNVPVDMWWLNSWQPPVAYSPRSTPTAYNTEAGLVIYGGVQVNKPNAYVPSANAKSVADVVQSSHPDVSGNAGGDLKEQVWTANTVEGNLKAVAASANAEPQDGGMNLAEVDLNFASPGALPLQFVRYYQSSWLGKSNLGPGWRVTPFVLEFQRPSWYDENSFMRNGGQALYKDVNKDTRLHSGGVRVVDLRSGGALDFNSSLQLTYGVDNIGNTVIFLAGLDANGIPTFTPGQRQSGGTLTQSTDNGRGYQFTTPDGAEMTFDFEGRLLTTRDKNGNVQTCAYDATGALVSITDAASQVLTLEYDSGAKLKSVTGPAGEKVDYTYTADGSLSRATHARSGAYVQYSYNANKQMNRKTRFNGLDEFLTDPDLKGRENVAIDGRGNTAASDFTQNAAGTVRTTRTSDPQVTDPAFQPSEKQVDRSGRVLMAKDTTGAATSFGYDQDSMAPNSINLPVAGRPTIRIERNAQGQPTKIVDPGNAGAQDVTATYDSSTKQLRTMTDASGAVSELMYDGNKRVERARAKHNGANVDTSYSYSASGAVRTVTDPLGKVASTIGRDLMDRVTSVTDATGVKMEYEYDSLGRLWKITDPRLTSKIEYVRDNFDRVIEVKTPAGSIFYSYDAAKGWLNSVTDILGRVTEYVRDPATGDILKVVEKVTGGIDRVTTMTRNRFGQLASLTPPGAAPINFNYDSIGRPTGSSETSTAAPGAPKALDSDRADNQVPTYNKDHNFTWGAPDSDSGIAGYSYSLDAPPAEAINVTQGSAAWKNVAAGSHTFQVKAQSNNGSWGDAAVFQLIVLPLTPYELWRRQNFTDPEVELEGVSGPLADPDQDGIDNLIEFVLNTAPKAASENLLPKLTTESDGAVFTFNRNLAATDVTLKIEACGDLSVGNWTPIATRTSGPDGTWSAITGSTVAEDSAGSVSVTDLTLANQAEKRFFRLKVEK